MLSKPIGWVLLRAEAERNINSVSIARYSKFKPSLIGITQSI